jgi:hypothetical protein
MEYVDIDTAIEYPEFEGFIKEILVILITQNIGHLALYPTVTFVQPCMYVFCKKKHLQYVPPSPLHIYLYSQSVTFSMI